MPFRSAMQRRLLRDAKKAAPRCRKGHPAAQERLDGRKDAAGDVFDGQAIYINNVMGDGFIGGAALGQQAGNAFAQGYVCVGRGRARFGAGVRRPGPEHGPARRLVAKALDKRINGGAKVDAAGLCVDLLGAVRRHYRSSAQR